MIPIIATNSNRPDTRRVQDGRSARRFQWLPVSERIKYKTACMCYNAINGSAPSYLSELLHCYNSSRSLCSSSENNNKQTKNKNKKKQKTYTQTPTLQPTAFVFFHTSVPTSGTISPKTLGTLLLSFPSKVNSRHFSKYNTIILFF